MTNDVRHEQSKGHDDKVCVSGTAETLREGRAVTVVKVVL